MRAVLPAGSEVGVRRRIRDDGAVDLQRVVMEADDERRGGDGPDPVGAFRHVEAGPDSHPHLLRVRSDDPEERSVVRVEAGVFRLGNVQRRGHAFVGRSGPSPAARRAPPRHQSQRALASWSLSPEPVREVEGEKPHDVVVHAPGPARTWCSSGSCPDWRSAAGRAGSGRPGGTGPSGGRPAGTCGRSWRSDTTGRTRERPSTRNGNVRFWKPAG